MFDVLANHSCFSHVHACISVKTHLILCRHLTDIIQEKLKENDEVENMRDIFLESKKKGKEILNFIGGFFYGQNAIKHIIYTNKKIANKPHHCI